MDLLIAERFIQGKLAADSALAALVSTRIYSEAAPAKATYPFVVYSHMGGETVRGAGAVLIMMDEFYVIKGVVKTNSYLNVSSIAARIQAVLDKASGAVTGGLALSCVMESPIKMALVDDDGNDYRHLGGIFRIFSQ